MPYRTILRNLLIFDLIWWGSVLGQKHDLPWIGLALVVAAFSFYQIWAKPGEMRNDLRLLSVTFVVGILVDVLHEESGVVVFSGFRVLPVSALFMLALWLNFGLQLNRLLRPLQSRLLLAAPLGAVSGMAAYWGAARLGALTLGDTDSAFALIALTWAVLTPGLLFLARCAHKAPPLQGKSGKTPS